MYYKAYIYKAIQFYKLALFGEDLPVAEMPVWPRCPCALLGDEMQSGLNITLTRYVLKLNPSHPVIFYHTCIIKMRV